MPSRGKHAQESDIEVRRVKYSFSELASIEGRQESNDLDNFSQFPARLFSACGSFHQKFKLLQYYGFVCLYFWILEYRLFLPKIIAAR